MSLRVMARIATRHVIKPKATSAPTRTRSVQPSKPNAALRTSSTQWCSGLNSPAICAHRGSPLNGKNVPATRNSGVRTALTM